MKDFIAKLKKKWILIRHLVEMKPFERAYVPMGANRWSFIVVKEANMERLLDLTKLQAGMQRLGQVVEVLKQGTPDQAAETKLLRDVAGAIDQMLPDLNINPKTSNPGLIVAEVLKSLRTLSLQAQSSDYAIADKLDVAAERLQSLLAAEGQPVPEPIPEVEPLNPEAPVVEPELEAAPEPAPEVVPEVEASSDPAPETPVEEEEEETSAAVAPAVEAEAQAESEVEASAEAPAAEVETAPETQVEAETPAEPEVVSSVPAEELEAAPVTLSMLNKVIEAINSINQKLEKLGEVKVVKQAPPQVLPATPPPDQLAGRPTQNTGLVDSSSIIKHDYNQSPILQAMDRYGRPIP